MRADDGVKPQLVHACARQERHPVVTAAYDCVTIIIVEDGSLILSASNLTLPIPAGHAVLIAPRVSHSYAPEGVVATTTLYLDTDYLIEHLYWQNLTLIADRDAARDLAGNLYPDPVQVLRIGEQTTNVLSPVLDDLVALLHDKPTSSGYFRTHALLFTVLEAVSPHIRHATVVVPRLTSRQRAVRVVAPRWRAFRPIRREIRAQQC